MLGNCQRGALLVAELFMYVRVELEEWNVKMVVKIKQHFPLAKPVYVFQLYIFQIQYRQIVKKNLIQIKINSNFLVILKTLNVRLNFIHKIALHELWCMVHVH